MRPSRSVFPPARGLRSVAAAAIAAGAILASLLVATPATAAVQDASTSPVASGLVKAAAVVGFDRENIISDAQFYDGNAMTAAQIQSFLDSKIGTCRNGKCLNVLTAGISSRDAVYSQSTGNLICSAIRGGTLRVSELIYRVQVACGISAKVILVTLQKEQGLATSREPSDWNLKAAMGASCPDSSPCDPAFSGVGPQILKGAQQLKTYKAAKFAKQPGSNWIGYSPNSACGGTTLNIRNYATAALYSYTPYQPNAAALAAGFGIGDGCSSYGNRNFYNYYTAWFGSTQAAVDPCKPPASEAWTAASGEVTTTANLNGRAAPTTACSTILKTFPTGTVVTRVATYDGWSRVRENGVYYWVHNDYVTATKPVTWKVDRLAGADRYETAAATSRAAFAGGAAVVFLASGADFPDALTAAAAAAKSSGSLLLTKSDGLPAPTRTELARLNPGEIVVVGGAGVVSDAVLTELAAMLPSAKITRIGGADRYETSALLAQSRFGNTSKVYIATGAGFADALAASAIAGAAGAPVLLVDGDAGTVSPTARDTLRALGVTSAVIAGGEGAVSAGVAGSIQSAGVAVTRFGGGDRYETSRLLNAAAYPGAVATTLMATGVDFPDALAGAVLAARVKAPLFSQPATCMRGDVKDWMIGHGTTSLRLLGGTGALSDEVAKGVRC